MDFSRYEKLRTLVRANFSEQTQALVDEALVYADGKLASLTRYDGSPLLTHAAAVAGIVISEVGLGRNSTISAILHDVVRLAHKQLPAEEFLALTADIRSRFGEQVVGITIGMCNISELKLKVAKEQAENFRDLLVSYSEDPRVILIKLADRLQIVGVHGQNAYRGMRCECGGDHMDVHRLSPPSPVAGATRLRVSFASARDTNRMKSLNTASLEPA